MPEPESQNGHEQDPEPQPETEPVPTEQTQPQSEPKSKSTPELEPNPQPESEPVPTEQTQAPLEPKSGSEADPVVNDADRRETTIHSNEANANPSPTPKLRKDEGSRTFTMRELLNGLKTGSEPEKEDANSPYRLLLLFLIESRKRKNDNAFDFLVDSTSEIVDRKWLVKYLIVELF